MRKKKNKKNIFFRKSSWLLIVIFIATLITIPSFTTKAEGRTVPVEVSGIKVLCIDPGAGTGNTTLTPGTTTLANGSTAIVTTMDMAEFISKVDEIRGQYDVVVLGRKNTGLIQDFDYFKQYRDYSAPLSQEYTYPSLNGVSTRTNGLYFIKPSTWGIKIPQAYIYDDYGAINTWPGSEMTDKGNGIYYYNAPTSISNAKVIFVDGNNSNNKFPVTGGLAYTVGTSLICDGAKLSLNVTTYPQLKYNITKWSDNKILYSSPQTNTDTVTANPKYSGFTNDGKTMIEYMSENDITAKRALAIESMIKGQGLVYFADEIFSNDLQNSKVNTIFEPYTNNSLYPNVQRVQQAQINLDNIVTYYNQNVSSSLKRPQITSLIASDDDSGITDYKGTANHRTMTYKFKFDSAIDPNTYGARIFLDLNADGMFSEENNEFAKDITKLSNSDVSNVGNQEFEISNILDNEFLGYLDWKIEIYKLNDVNTKTSMLGSSIFKPLVGKKRLTVLQIYPDVFRKGVNVNGENLYVSLPFQNGDPASKKSFENWVNNPNVANSGYELKINAMSCANFNTMVTDEDSLLKYKTSDGDFLDMIIVGFSDAYGNNNEFDDTSVKAIKKFMQKKKSVMLTHDTISLNTFSSENFVVGPKLLGQGLRDYVGQARYSDVNRKGVETDLDGDPIHHDSLSNATNYSGNTNVSSMGTTLYSSQYEATKTTAVKNMNKGQITSYPYQVPNNLQVKLTHTQWFQLNLEDEDVVPWYNLVPQANAYNGNNANKFDSGDSRNYYYTYSKGNITYSGTGHAAGGDITYPDGELQLFVNTIIKASRGGNTAPTIKNLTSSNNLIDTASTVSPDIQRSADYEFISVPFDNEKDTLKVTIKATGLNSSGGVVNENVIYADTEYKQYSIKNPITGVEETKFGVKVPKSLYENNLDVKKVKIETNVEDVNGATGSNSFYLQLSSNQPPIITNKYTENNSVIENGSTIATKVLKTTDYDFISLPTDPEDANVKVTIKANDQNVNEVNADGTLGAIITDLAKDKDKDIKVRIPKGVYGDNSEITVTTTVTDSKGASDTKTFILKINQPPTITNKYLNTGVVIGDGATVSPEVKRTDAYYDFISLPQDSDDTQVKVTITANGQNVNEVNTDGTLGGIINGSTKSSNADIKVRIPNSVYKNVVGNEITVTTIVTDVLGATETKTFKLQIAANGAPNITNYYFDSYYSSKEEIPNEEFAKTKVDSNAEYYDFISVPSDTEDEKVKVTIKVGDDVVNEVNNDGTLTPLNEINKNRDEEIIARIPKSYYEGKSQITVTTIVEDEMGATSTKTFKLNMNKAPTIINKDLAENVISSDVNALPIVVSGTEDYEFLSIPNDQDDSNVFVTITADDKEVQKQVSIGWSNGINNSSEVCGVEMRVRIPKTTFTGHKPGDKIIVTTKVRDKMGLEEIKTFKLQINEAPTITNKYLDTKNIIESGYTIIDVERTENYDFISIPNDTNDDKVFVSIQAEGVYLNEVDSVVPINNILKTSGNEINVRIPKELYEGKTQITVTTTVKDIRDNRLTQTKTFNVKIVNYPPTINNYKLSGDLISKDDSIIVPRTLDYSFNTIAQDPESGLLKLSAVLRDKDGVVIYNTPISEGVISGNTITFNIPKESLLDFIPGDVLDVVVTAEDDQGAKTTKGFKLVIDQIVPTLSHSLVVVDPVKDTTTNEITNDPTYFADTKNVIYFKNHDFVGNISNLFDNTATVFLTLDADIKLKSDISIYEVDSNGAEKSLGTIVKDGETKNYSYVLNSNRTLSKPVDGIKIRVKYIAEIYKLPTTTEKSYSNVLKVGSSDPATVTIKSKQSDFVPDLF